MAGIAEWFATYVYLPKPCDRVVPETAIRDALARLDPKFAYAAGFDKALANIQGSPGKRPRTGRCRTPPCWAAGCVGAAPPRCADAPTGDEPNTTRRRRCSRFTDRSGADREPAPRRLFGSVEIDMVRPVKAFEAILNACWCLPCAYQGERASEASALKVLIELVSPSGFEPETY